LSRRTKQIARIVAPVVVYLNPRSQEDDGYEFDDMSRRTSSKEREGSPRRRLQDEETVPDDNDESSECRLKRLKSPRIHKGLLDASSPLD
jgi:hypothetical protein